MSAAGRGPRLDDSGADFYATPAWTVHRLLEAADFELYEDSVLFEPCVGDGAIVSAVNEHFNQTLSWTGCELRKDTPPLIGFNYGVDFLAACTAVGEPPDLLITNPPFSLAMEFIQQAMRLFPDTPLTFLLRINFLASAERAGFMRQHTPDVYVLPNRPSFRNGRTDATEYAWFVWPGTKQRLHGKLTVLAPTPADERR